MEATAEKSTLSEQRAQKKAARRAAFIQEVAEAVWKMQPKVAVSSATVKAASKSAIARAEAEATTIIKGHPLLQES